MSNLNICEGNINDCWYTSLRDRQGLAYFIKPLPNHNLCTLSTTWPRKINSPSAKLTCPQSCLVIHWICLIRHKTYNTTMATATCLATGILHQTWMGKDSTLKLQNYNREELWWCLNVFDSCSCHSILLHSLPIKQAIAKPNHEANHASQTNLHFCGFEHITLPSEWAIYHNGSYTHRGPMH